MELVVIGHLVGDFYLQTAKMAEKKKTSVVYMLLHCMLYAVAIYVTVVIQSGKPLDRIWPALLISILHGCVDSIKIGIEKKWRKAERDKCWIFLIDQCLHIVILIFVSKYYQINLSDVSIIQQEDVVYAYNIIAVVMAVLICWKPAAIFVSMVLTVFSEFSVNADKQNDNKQANNEENEIAGVGSWIGILEREVILLLGLLGQYSAIGFVLTAKSVARYNDLNDKGFAEKYLIGTLLSALIALACVGACSLILQ